MPSNAPAKGHQIVSLECPACGGEDCRYDPEPGMRCVYCGIGEYRHKAAAPTPCPEPNAAGVCPRCATPPAYCHCIWQSNAPAAQGGNAELREHQLAAHGVTWVRDENPR